MKMGEIRDMSEKELGEKLAEARKELRKERSIIASGTRPDNPCKIRSIRKNIARMLTVLGEKELTEKENKEKKEKEVIKE